MNRSPTRARWAFLIASALCANGAQAQLSSTNSRLFIRGTADGLPFAILGRLQSNVAGFGEAMAVGDFNCDGIEDLAIGAPDANANNVVHSGQVVIAYGSARGLRSDSGIGLSQSSPNMPGGSEPGDHFGWAVAAGDLSGDGCDDLVVGTPGEDFESPIPFTTLQDAGSLTVLQGRSTGMTGVGAFNLPREQEFFGLDGPQSGASFGHALAIGNVFSARTTSNMLIIGLPDFDALPFETDAGAIDVRASSSTTLDRRVGRFYNDTCCFERNEPFDDFGRTLTIGDFDGDDFQDVAIGVPGETVNGRVSAGAVSVVFGGPGPVGSGGWINFNMDSPGLPGSSAAFELLGDTMAAGDFDADGDSDLVLGISRKIIGNQFGRLIIRNGRSDGVNGFADSQLFTGNDVGLPVNQSNLFSYALAVGDFNGDGHDDLAAGAPSVDTSGVADSGAVVVMYGTTNGIALTGRQIWHKGSPGIPGDLGVGEEFGAGLAAGDFNADGVDDLVIAIPQQILGTTPRGGVLVIYGRRAVASLSQTSTPNPTPILADGFD